MRWGENSQIPRMHDNNREYGVYVSLNQGDDCMEAEVSPSVSSPGSLGILNPRTPAYVDSKLALRRGGPLSRARVSPHAGASQGATQTMNEGPRYLQKNSSRASNEWIYTCREKKSRGPKRLLMIRNSNHQKRWHKRDNPEESGENESQA